MADRAVAKVCPLCKNTTWVSVPVEAYEAWQKETFEENEQG